VIAKTNRGAPSGPLVVAKAASASIAPQWLGRGPLSHAPRVSLSGAPSRHRGAVFACWVRRHPTVRSMAIAQTGNSPRPTNHPGPTATTTSCAAIRWGDHPPQCEPSFDFLSQVLQPLLRLERSALRNSRTSASRRGCGSNTNQHALQLTGPTAVRERTRRLARFLWSPHRAAGNLLGPAQCRPFPAIPHCHGTVA